MLHSLVSFVSLLGIAATLRSRLSACYIGPGQVCHFFEAIFWIGGFNDRGTKVNFLLIATWTLRFRGVLAGLPTLPA